MPRVTNATCRHDGCKHPSTAAADTIMAMARKQTRSSSSVVRPSSYQVSLATSCCW